MTGIGKATHLSSVAGPTNLRQFALMSPATLDRLRPSAPLNLARRHAVESNVPVGCGGVAVYPGDVIVGDRDGVVVIPVEMADEVARDAAEQEELEEFLLQRVIGGAALPGTYPPNEATRAAFEQWRNARPRR